MKETSKFFKNSVPMGEIWSKSLKASGDNNNFMICQNTSINFGSRHLTEYTGKFPMPPDFIDAEKLEVLMKLKAKFQEDSVKIHEIDTLWIKWNQILLNKELSQLGLPTLPADTSSTTSESEAGSCIHTSTPLGGSTVSGWTGWKDDDSISVFSNSMDQSVYSGVSAQTGQGPTLEIIDNKVFVSTWLMDHVADAFYQSLETRSRERSRIPQHSVEVMRRWIKAHQDNPFPDEMEREALAREANLSVHQVNSWLDSARRRWRSRSINSIHGIVERKRHISEPSATATSTFEFTPPASRITSRESSRDSIRSNLTSVSAAVPPKCPKLEEPGDEVITVKVYTDNSFKVNTCLLLKQFNVIIYLLF